jgi:hypothetical protein
MTKEEVIDYFTSRDEHKIRVSSCEIIHNGQNHEKIKHFIEFLPLILEKTKDLNLGGGFAPNQRFVDFAIKTIEYHKIEKECYCGLYVEKYFITNDVVKRELQYECFDPRNEHERGNIEINKTIRMEYGWIDYYEVKCKKCNKKYKVKERDGHYTFWNWKFLE